MITTIGIGLAMTGAVLLYAAITGQSITTEFRAALGG